VDFPTEAGIPRSVVPGVLCPDGPVAVAGRPAIIRLRQLLGKAFVVLTQKVPCDFGDQPAPVDTYDLATIDTEGVISKALTLEDHRAAVIRPDGHIAAIVDAAEVHGAINRALGVARP
jgi:pentachlorophenol monooxygenase/3-(3-hydroxy-phenyl)propionate hydroxylase